MNNIKEAGACRFEQSDENVAEEIISEKTKQRIKGQQDKLARLNFSPSVRFELAARVGFKCSRCGIATIGPNKTTQDMSVITGQAAHIYGAYFDEEGNVSNDSPRPAPKTFEDGKPIKQEYIKSFDNGIWLCRNCHALVDSVWGDGINDRDELLALKKEAETKQLEALEMPVETKVKEILNESFFEEMNEKCHIDCWSFGAEEWCLLMYVDVCVYQKSRSEISPKDYVDWLTENSIQPKDAGMIKKYYNFNEYWDFKDEERIKNSLTGLICLEPDEDGTWIINRKSNFDSLIESLYQLNENYMDKILNKYSRELP